MLAGVVAAGFQRVDPDAIAIFNAMDTKPNAARKTRIKAAVVALKDDGIWSKLDRLWVMAAHEQGVTSRLDWKSPATTGRRLTEVNSPTFTANQGYTGNASNMYLNTNFTQSTDGVNMTQDSACGFVWVRNVGSSSTHVYFGGGPTRTLIYRQSSASAWVISGPSGPNTAVIQTTLSNAADGLLAANRSGASQRHGYRNGVVESSNTAASVGTTTEPFYILAWNNGGSPANLISGQISFAGVGGSLTATEHANLHTALNTYMTGLADDYS